MIMYVLCVPCIREYIGAPTRIPNYGQTNLNLNLSSRPQRASPARASPAFVPACCIRFERVVTQQFGQLFHVIVSFFVVEKLARALGGGLFQQLLRSSFATLSPMFCAAERFPCGRIFTSLLVPAV